jgi:hypothetical protein
MPVSAARLSYLGCLAVSASSLQRFFGFPLVFYVLGASREGGRAGGREREEGTREEEAGGEVYSLQLAERRLAQQVCRNIIMVAEYILDVLKSGKQRRRRSGALYSRSHSFILAQRCPSTPCIHCRNRCMIDS